MASNIAAVRWPANQNVIGQCLVKLRADRRQKFLGCLGRRDGNLSLAAEAGIEIEKIKWFAHFGVAALVTRGKGRAYDLVKSATWSASKLADTPNRPNP
ncbi:hypothetical protein IVB38_28125 [Bradyrhizobium sp. 38]|uniref:hypothetical protein n=1 Tax=unclassified Bradyrhizobium TaxID=2631580 RepID=UPI001FFB00DA|nr:MULTISPECIES: hypothetical protein [unclassified Bradyrhizobium]MCK1339766.1 hypothetical protein [Bradyrhizobium sp. 38]MCK1777985.1 hypothetical protein [Bradyrhizobium sp. 132]